ncbi:MAG: hypothetical protein DRH56_07060, partial [Deltaproteobacteria bacterium]
AGPVLMGVTGLAVRRILMPPGASPEQAARIGQTASRFSIGSLLVLFLAGAILFHFVDEEKARENIRELARSEKETRPRRAEASRR